MGWMANVDQRRHARVATAGRRLGRRPVAVIEPIDDDDWNRVPDPGTWSIGKEAEHVAEAIVYHLWIVRLTIGQKVSSRRPALERKQMTTPLSQHEAADLIHERAE